MPLITGRFYFKLTDAGNLVGEYSNEKTFKSLPESALRDDPTSTRSFIGDYISTWYETNDKRSVAAKLKITAKKDSVDLFLLRWEVLSNPSHVYFGEAMLCDGRLIGNYWLPDPCVGKIEVLEI